MTFGGNNAEAYWNSEGTELSFQSEWSGLTDQGCDQIFLMNADGSARESGDVYDLVSATAGRTTCAYFLPDGRILYASTHRGGPECPIAPMFDQGRYVWPIFEDYDIYSANPDGTDVQLLIGGPGYDAEATVSPDGRYVLFTSTRSGDLELWRYELESGDLLQLTDLLGYDGGAFFSADSQKIVWRAGRPTGEEGEAYKALLEEGLIEPALLDVFIADADGSNVQQVTDLPGANWAPFFHPSGEQIVFSSNHHSLDEGGRIFDVYRVNLDGSDLTQITHSGVFDSFPAFSPDGTRLAFSSNRNGSRTFSRDTNVFVADWIENPEEVDLQFGLD